MWKVNLEKTVARLATAQTAKPRTFARYADLLALKEIDAVIIATPDFAHTPVLIDAIKAGKDAFVEKPMATVLDHAKTAQKLVKEKGAIVQVGTQRRSDRRHQEGAQASSNRGSWARSARSRPPGTTPRRDGPATIPT